MLFYPSHTSAADSGQLDGLVLLCMVLVVLVMAVVVGGGIMSHNHMDWLRTVTTILYLAFLTNNNAYAAIYIHALDASVRSMRLIHWHNRPSSLSPAVFSSYYRQGIR